MENIECSVCKKTNHRTENQLIIVATFAQKFHAKDTLFEIEKSHIIPVWSYIFSQNEILGKQFTNSQTLVIQLHGIKDIIQLQSLYIESICQDNNSLTVDIISSKNMQHEIMRQF